MISNRPVVTRPCSRYEKAVHDPREPNFFATVSEKRRDSGRRERFRDQSRESETGTEVSSRGYGSPTTHDKRAGQAIEIPKCEPTTHRLVRRVFLPTTHRLLGRQPEPTLPPTELSVRPTFAGHWPVTRSGRSEEGLGRSARGKSQETKAFEAWTLPTVGLRFAVARNQKDDTVFHEKLSPPTPIDAMRCRFGSASH